VDPQPPVWRWGDPIALSVAIALIAVSALVGRSLNERGVPLVLPEPPLLATWDPHLGWGTPLAIGCVLVGLRLQTLAAGVPWRRLLLAGWLLNLAWMCSLTLIDGLHRGWIRVLLDPNEYLHDLPRITDPVSFLAMFTDFIAFTDPVAGLPEVWTTHVAAHPPLATLIFWWLDQVGLGGGFWAGALCILVSSVAAVGLPVVLAELGAETAARRVVPFIALFPGAVWMAVSADGLFAGVALGGLALVCKGAARRQLLTSLAGGLLLGAAVFLSYGLVLFGLVVLLALVLTVRRYGLRRCIGPWLVSVVGSVAVVAVHLAFGFNWLTGLSELHIRYYQGIAGQRAFSYFVYANLAAWLVSCSPLLAIGLARSLAVGVRGRLVTWSQGRVVALLALSGLLAALIADLSALSKAETERIWLSFGVVAYAGLALLRGRAATWALVGCAGWALLVNHLLDTGW
jgi:methylthioxylose transferase